MMTAQHTDTIEVLKGDWLYRWERGSGLIEVSLVDDDGAEIYVEHVMVREDFWREDLYPADVLYRAVATITEGEVRERIATL